MIHAWFRGRRPTYSSASNYSEPVDAEATCENRSSSDQLIQGQLTAVEWECDFTGSVPVWSDGSAYVWECPRCGWEHREEPQP